MNGTSEEVKEVINEDCDCFETRQGGGRKVVIVGITAF